MTRFWLKTGRYITETENSHKQNYKEGTVTGYGRKIIEKLSEDLIKKYDKGSSVIKHKEHEKILQVI